MLVHAGTAQVLATVALLDRGERVLGLDNMSPYYDPALKRARLARLEAKEFSFQALDLSHRDEVAAFGRQHPEIDRIVHLAAQAGVRKSWGPDFVVYTTNNIEATQVLLYAGRAACASARKKGRLRGDGPCQYGGMRRAYRIWLRKSLVRSCCGFLKNSLGVFISTIWPASINTMRLATCRAKPIS